MFSIWGHAYEFHDTHDWAGLERIFKPLSGHADAWYCTNIELFDYEEARRRVQIAGNRATVFNPSTLTVTLVVDGRLVDVAAVKLVQIV